MTILEASNLLTEFFLSNDSFHLAFDFKKIKSISDTDADKAAILLALEELAKEQIIAKKEIDGLEFWILVKPLVLLKQDVRINLMTAINVANIINKYATKDEDKAHPMNISEQDIINLVEIAKMH